MKASNLKIHSSIISAVFIAMVFIFAASISHATTLTFENITNNSSVQLSEQLSTDVNSVGTTGVEFTFYNNVGIASSITDIYFDLGTNTGLFTEFSISDQSVGVSFDLTPHPANLPSGETISFYSDFGGDSTVPTSDSGEIGRASCRERV